MKVRIYGGYDAIDGVIECNKVVDLPDNHPITDTSIRYTIYPYVDHVIENNEWYSFDLTYNADEGMYEMYFDTLRSDSYDLMLSSFNDFDWNITLEHRKVGR